MRVLFDHNIDRRFRPHLAGHEVVTAREMGWEQLENGALLRAAAGSGFDLLLSLDKKLEHERNLATLPIAVVVLDGVSNALPALLPFSGHLLTLFASPLEPCLYLIELDGTVHRLTKPRPRKT